MSAKTFAALACALLAFSACRPVPAAEFGRQLFFDARFAESRFNAFSCATCHDTTGAPDPKRILPGHTMVGAASRPRYWGGYETRLIDAVSFCYVYFMRGPGPLDPAEPRAKALYEYLAQLSPDPHSPELPLTIVRNMKDVPRQDAVRGRAVYDAACKSCHGEAHTGAGRLTELAPILPEVKDTFPEPLKRVPPGLVFIEKVRHGQFFGVGGNMPPFSLESLSDEDLGAMLAYFGL